MAMQSRRRRSRPDPLSAVFGALASPVRRGILEQLATGVYSVTELGAPWGMSQPTISKHLRVLEEAGLVERGKDAQWRPRALRADPLAEADGWLEQFRALWEARLDRLERYLTKLERDT